MPEPNHKLVTESTRIELPGQDAYPVQCRVWQADRPRAVVVFLHGVVSHSLWLESICLALAGSGYMCIGMDRRGAGANPSGRGDAPSAEHLLADLDAIVTWALSHELPVHACGFCWGANYLLNYVSDYDPALVSIALLAPSIFPADVITRQTLITGESAEPSEIPLIPLQCFTQGHALQDFILPDPLRIEKVSPRFNRIMSEFSQGLWMKLLRLACPVFIALGEWDEVVDNAATVSLYDRLSTRCKSLQVFDAMHGIQFDASGELTSALSDWFEQAQSSVDAARQENEA